jgi:hypothetical protein
MNTERSRSPHTHKRTLRRTGQGPLAQRLQKDLSMLTTPEHRSHERRECPGGAEVSYSFFNRTRFYGAQLLNFSDRGVYFTSRQPLLKGTIVLMRFDRSSSGRSATDWAGLPCSLALAEIRWCQPCEEAPETVFKIGAQFMFGP